MIYYLVSPGHGYTMSWLLEDWEPGLASCVTVLSYDEALTTREAPGTYIFADLERVSATHMIDILALRDRLVARSDVRVLNDPRRVLLRYDLLRELHADGINPFTVHRVSDVMRSEAAGSDAVTLRYPVFVRAEGEHWNALTPLLRDWAELEEAVRRVATGYRCWYDELLVVEFCDTSRNGIFTGHGAFIVDGQVLARHLQWGREWVVDGNRIEDDEHRRASDEYVRRNPHADQLAPIARRAGIDYGRFDYAMLDGRPVIWEINTNPTVMPSREKYTGKALETEMAAIAPIADALRALASGAHYALR